MVKPSRDRVEISTASGLGLNISPKRKPGRWALFWVPFAFAFWIYGMYGSIVELMRPGDDTVLLFSSLALVGLVVAGMVGLPAFLWNVFGREIVELYAGRFIVAKELGGIRYRSKSFNTLDVEGLRTDPGPGSLHSLARLIRGRLTFPGNIAFEAKGETYRFGAYLEEEETRETVERIRKCLPNMRSHP